ncbi:lysozyme [Humidesulfovibrio mexicanus]|uniref:Lysozyme n=1 Tax=Humidesulfovibrio mexicanus TaxID=147047 RepID=A0A239C910_9BACT|nr:glycoside hydrolase family protein [Humidesulfovibrio mexicanus]SNS16590.1 lysozyme [Humidesulfovibrio mexicanus]
MNTHRLAKQLLTDEGLKLKPYRCTAGKLTIGVGRNLEDRGITEDEAMLLLQNDIKRCWGQVVGALPWVLNAPEPVQEALVNMCFNLGLAGLLKFKNTLAHLEAGEYELAEMEMLDSAWAKQVGARANRLGAMVHGCAKQEG